MKGLDIADIEFDKERGEQILRELCIVERQMTIAKVEAAQARAVHCEGLFIRRAILPHRKAYKDQIAHVSHEVERQAELLIPHRVETVVLHNTRAT